MKHRISSTHQLRLWFVGLVFLISMSTIEAQASASLLSNGTGFQWKDQNTIVQIVQEELTNTNAELALPNLTDWSTAMLEAYKSLLVFTQAGMPEAHDMMDVLNIAFVKMQTEPIQHPESRTMVMDDMKGKLASLVQKLTYQ